MSDKKEKFFKKIEVDGSDKEGEKKEPKKSKGFSIKDEKKKEDGKKVKPFFKKKDNDGDGEKELDEGKKNRCWKGYKPAKGKKPYSSGSCVKEGSLWSNWRQLRESNESCSCQCKSCKDGNCGGCSCQNCNCEGCSC